MGVSAVQAARTVGARSPRRTGDMTTCCSLVSVQYITAMAVRGRLVGCAWSAAAFSERPESPDLKRFQRRRRAKALNRRAPSSSDG